MDLWGTNRYYHSGSVDLGVIAMKWYSSPSDPVLCHALDIEQYFVNFSLIVLIKQRQIKPKFEISQTVNL